jgi:hypothetical protein
MNLNFVCMDEACAKKGGSVFHLNLATEAVEEKNLATLLCHRCGLELHMTRPASEAHKDT